MCRTAGSRFPSWRSRRSTSPATARSTTPATCRSRSRPRLRGSSCCSSIWRFRRAGSLTRVRQAASHFVRSLGPRDLVAVATYGRSGLKVLTSFTLDRAYVARIIDTLGLSPLALAPTDPLGLSGGDTSGTNYAGFDVEGELQEEQELINRTMVQNYRRNVLDFLGGLEDLSQALAPLRGRKQSSCSREATRSAPGQAPTSARHPSRRSTRTARIRPRSRRLTGSRRTCSGRPASPTS